MYLEEHSMHCQTENVRKLAGYRSDLKHLLPENKQASLSMYLFNEYLQEGVYELLNNSSHMKQVVVQWQWSVVNKALGLIEIHFVCKNVLFIPLHLCAAIKRRYFKYISFAVSSAMFMNNFNVYLIWSYVNKTFIHSITSCTPLQHPLSEEVFVHSKFCIVFLLLS